jgi:hypothetical protein
LLISHQHGPSDTKKWALTSTEKHLQLPCFIPLQEHRFHILLFWAVLRNFKSLRRYKARHVELIREPKSSSVLPFSVMVSKFIYACVAAILTHCWCPSLQFQVESSLVAQIFILGLYGSHVYWLLQIMTMLYRIKTL